MAKVSVECPGCFAKLNLADRSKLGKKIKCPKCAEVFVPEAPDDDDDDTEMLDEDDLPARSSGGRKRPAAGGGKNKKPAKKSGGSSGGNKGLLIGGGIAGLLVLVVAGLYFGGVFGGQKPLPAPPAVVEAAPPPVAAPKIEISPAEKMLALRWMPADTELLVHVKVADIWQAPLLKSALDTPEAAAGVAEFQQKTGLVPTEIESITLGVADLTGALLRSKSASGPPLPPPGSGPPGSGPPGFGPAMLPNPLTAIRPEDQRVVVVVRTKKSVDFEAIAKTAPNGQMKDKNGKKYVEVPSQPSQPASGGWSPDSNTLIFGTLTDLLATIDRGETVTPRKEFAGVDHTSHLVLASVVKETKPEDLPAGIEMPAGAAMMQESLKQYGLQGVSLGLSIKGGFDLKVSAMSGSADGAKKLKTDIETQLAGLKDLFGLIKASQPPLYGELGDMLLNGLKIDEQSQVVKITTGIPDSAQQKLEQLPAVVMKQIFEGGINTLAGGPDKDSNANFSPGLSTTPGAVNLSPGNFGEMKKPGETAAVDAAKAEGLPDGITLSAKTSWNEFPDMSADGKSTFPIQLMLDAKGDGLSTICAFGQVAPKTMTLEGGGVLKTSKNAMMMFGPDPLKSLVPYDFEDPFGFDHPKGTMRVKFSVEPPAAAAAKITALEGTFKYLTSEKSDEFTISEAPKKALKALADPELKAAGVKLLLAKGGGLGGETLTLSCGKGHFLGKVGMSNPDDANGVTQYFNSEIDKGQTVYRIQAFEQGGKFSEKMQVKFKLHRDVKEHTVSFRFENVPLPTPDSKPKAQTQ